MRGISRLGGSACAAAVVAGAFVLVRPAASAPATDPATRPLPLRVTAPSGLHVRKEPRLGSTVLGVAPYGAVYAAVERSGAWYRLWFGERTGWAHGAWLDDDGSALVRVVASTLNIRTGPGLSHRVIGHAHDGAYYAVRERSGNWRRFDFGQREGWASATYLRAAADPATPAPDPQAPAPVRSRAGFILLPAEGPGFFAYSPEARRWGTPRLIEGIQRVARRWKAERPAGMPARFGVGDVSLENGGEISGHASHERGIDADIALPRNDGHELPRVDRFDREYSRAGTQKLVDLFRAELPVKVIYFNDRSVSGVSPWPSHDNHFHVRISP